MSIKRSTMRAAALDRFGGIETIQMKTLPVPEPGPDEVLLRVESAGVGVWDPYEREGDIPNTVFPCGLVHDPKSGEVRLYYGAADTTICVATAQLEDLLAAVRSD